MFKNREQAGQLLGQKVQEIMSALPDFQPERTVVVALPRGGVPVAKAVSAALRCQLTILVSKKIGAPFQPELAIGAVTSSGEVVLNDRLGFVLKGMKPYVDAQRKRLMRETKILEKHWLEAAGLSDSLSLKGKRTVLVDDGVATGMTTLAAIRSLKAAGATEVILATPVIPEEASDRLGKELNRIIALETPGDFLAIGQFYDDFHQVEDQEVIDVLKAFTGHGPAVAVQPGAGL